MLKALLISALVNVAPMDVADVPSPAPSEPTPVPQVPVSVISVPITLNLTALPEVLEKEVPPSIEAMGAWTMVADDRIGIKYRATRSPFEVFIEGDSLRAATEVEYEAEACIRQRRPLLGGYICPKVASCGQGEPRRQVHVAGSSVLGWSPEWYLLSATSFQLGYPNRCHVTFLDYDVTPLIDRALTGYLSRAAKDLDTRVREVTNARSYADNLWRAASTPIELQPSTWLLLSPKEIRVAPLRGSGLVVNTAIELVFQPSITMGARPEVTAVPLPPLKEGASGKGFHVALEAKLTFEEATRLLGEMLPLKATFEDMEVEVRKVDVSGLKGRALFKLSVHIASGLPDPTDVTLYLSGKPRYDKQTGTLSIDELDYTAESRDLVVKRFDRLIHTQLRSKLQQRASWRMERQFDTYRQALESALKGLVLSNVVTLKGSIKSIEPLGIVTTESAFMVVVEANGDVDATLTLPISRND